MRLLTRQLAGRLLWSSMMANYDGKWPREQVKKDSVAVAQKRQEAEADAVARRQIERGLLHSDRRSPSPQR